MGPEPEVKPGASIAIFWDLDRKWYNAEVLDYDLASGICQVVYADGEREELALKAEKYRLLWAGKLRERMGKVGGDSGWQKHPLAYIADTLLDIEDRLPPRGVQNNSNEWWCAWRSSVKNGGKSGNFQALRKAAVEIAFEMKDNVSTSWWKSQSITWRKQVESATTGSSLSSHLNDLLKKAVDWSAARRVFSSESPDSGENRQEKLVVENGQIVDIVAMDRSGVDDKGTPSRVTRLQEKEEKLVVENGQIVDIVVMDRSGVDDKGTPSRVSRLQEKEENSQAGGKVDEEGKVKTSTSDSALRRSKRKRIPGDDEEGSHVDSPRSENLTITDNSLSIVKNTNGGIADEGSLSHANVDHLEKAQSDINTPEGQSCVDETKKKEKDIYCIEDWKEELRIEDGQLEEFDRKTRIAYTRVRVSKRCYHRRLGPSADGQTSETAAFGDKVDAVSAEPILEAGNAMVLNEHEGITHLKDTTISVRSPRRSLRSSGLKNELGNAEFSQVSPGQESSPMQECRSFKDVPQQLNQDSDVKIPRRRGRPRKIKTSEVVKEDDGDGREKSRNANESPGISSTKDLCLSAQDSNLVTPEPIATRVETRLGNAGDTNEPGQEDDGGGNQKSRSSTESPGIGAAKDHSLSAQYADALTREVMITRVDTKVPKVGHAGELGKEDDNAGEKLTRRHSTESPGISATRDLGLSAQDSNVVTPEVIVTQIETKLPKAEHVGEIVEEDDNGGEKQMRRNSTESLGISAAKALGMSAQDSSVVKPEVMLTGVETTLQKAEHAGELGKEDDDGREKHERRNSSESPGICAAKDLGPFAQDSNVVTQELLVTRVETQLENAEHAGELEKEDELDGKEKGMNSTEPLGSTTEKNLSVPAPDSNVIQAEMTLEKAALIEEGNGRSGAIVGRSKRIIRKPKKYDSADNESPKPHKATEGRQGRIGARGKGKQVNSSIDADNTVPGKENGNDRAGMEKSSVGQKALQVGEGRDVAGPDNSESSIDVTPKRRGRLIRKTSETEVNGKEGAQKPESPKQEMDIKQVRHNASVARVERMRVRSGGARVDVLDDDGTDESSGEDEHNYRAGKRNSRKRQRSPSSESSYKVPTSSSEEASEEEFKVSNDTKEAESLDLDDSWGERLPNEDAEDSPSMQGEIKQPEPGQSPPSPESPEADGDAECAVCSFAGADELMLLCDQSGCTCAIHTFCLNPPVAAIPEGEWLCPHCTRSKDLKDKHLDTRRLPKTCSNYPAKSVGSLIGRRKEPPQPEGKTQYLVKWNSLSHEHDTWIPENWILYMSPRQLSSFKKKHSLAESGFDVDERKPEWVMVDRIIASRKQGSKMPLKPSQVSDLLQSGQQHNIGVEFLVKWQALEHKSATWEKERDAEEFQQAISSYTKRHEAAEESCSRKKEMKQAADLIIQPDYLSGGTMYNFQIHGLKWLLSNFYQRRNVILADEMGMGKTLQALAFISCVRYEGLSSKPALVIAPKSTLSSWEQEFRTWVPGLNVVLYQGDKENRALIRQYEFYTASKKPLFEVLLTTYEFASSDTSFLSKYHWAALVVDEGHRVKNVQSHLGAKLKIPTADFRLLLTGTPVQNNLEELFTLLNFLDPEAFPDPVDSAKQFIEVDVHGNKAECDGTVIEQQVARLKELLNPRMLRRLKKEVLSGMIPKKKLVQVSCALTPLQRHLYAAILTKNFEILNKGVKRGLKTNLNNILMELRKVCGHPYLFPEKEPKHLGPEEAYKMMVAASGKFQLLEKLLPLLKEQGHRVLLFSQWTKMLDIVEDFINLLGLSYSRLDGNSSASSRQKSIEEFNSGNSSTFIFLISTRAGGLGINLATADTVILYDPDFNPFVDIQAQARAHRIGQDKKVLVYQLLTKCSVEEKILQRSRKKLAMENLVMNKEESKETAQDINTLLLHGAQKVLDEHSIEHTSVTWTDESVKKLLDRDTLTSTGNDDEPTAHGYLGAVEGDGFVSPAVNGEEEQEPQGGDGNQWYELLQHSLEPIEAEELGRGKRVRKQVKYDVEGGHGEGHEEDEYNPSSNESSSDSDESMDSEGMTSKHHRKIGDQVVGGALIGEYPGIPGTSNSSQATGTPSHFFPGGTPIVSAALPWNSGLHASILSGSSQRLPGSSTNMVHQATLTPQAAPSLGTMGSFNGPGSKTNALLLGMSRAACASRGAGAYRVGSAPPPLLPMSMNPAILRDPSQFAHMSAETIALQSRTLMSGTGQSNTQFVNPTVPFPGVYPYANNSTNPYAAPLYPQIPGPGPQYMPYNAHHLPSQQPPSHFLLNDGRVNPQSLNTQNPGWSSFSDLQQAAQCWSTSNVEQRSTPAVSRMAWSDKGGGYMPSGQQGSSGGYCQLPTMSSAAFQSVPSSVQGRSAAFQSAPSSVQNRNAAFQSAPSSAQSRGRTPAQHRSSGKQRRVTYSSNAPSAAAAPAAPWLAGYCTVAAPLSAQVEPQVISASQPTPAPFPPVPLMSGIPHIPQLYSALDFHDPTALQVTPVPMNILPSARVPEPLAVRASAVVDSIPSPAALKFTPPHLDLRPISPLDRNSSSRLHSQAQTSVMPLPHAVAVNAVPTLPMPQTLQSPTFASALGLPTIETGADGVDGMFIGGGSTSQSQPALAALRNQIVNGGGSTSGLSVHQLEGIDPASTPRQLPTQGRKPLWVPKGDAGLLMGPVFPSGVIKVEEGT